MVFIIPIELPEVAIGGPVGGGAKGLNHSCQILIVGLLAVPEKVIGTIVAQVIACDNGVTVVVGAIVFIPIAKVCV